MLDLNFEGIKNILILIMGFGVVAIAANKIASLFQKINLPIITGFLITGIICGPFVLKLIPSESIGELNFINEIALAFIAFAAGAELYFRELMSRLNSIKWNTISHLFFSFGIGSISVFFMSDYIPFMQELNFNSRLAISLLTGSVFVARSPASAIAIINELRAKGPFTQTVIGVTVLIDFMVIMIFAVCFSLTESLVNGSEIKFISFLIPVGELLLSFAVGYLLGKVLERLLSFKIHTYSKAFFIIMLGYSVYVLNHILAQTVQLAGLHLRLEPLITCIIASLYITNYTKFKPEFLSILKSTGPMIYAAFFTLTGAGLNIHTLYSIWFIAVMFFALRLATIIAGSYLGGFLAKDPPRFMHLGWMPYITQAGVALGLATLVANQYPTWGKEFSTIMVGIIVLNQIVGPPLFKRALFKVGEDKSRGSFTFDGIRDAVIFGYESQSIALSHELMNKDWKVKLVTLMKKGSFEEPNDISIHYMEKLSVEEISKLGTGRSEAIVCMLSDRENLKICEIAYHYFGTPDMIVRLNERENHEKFLALGARVVDPSTAIVSLMDHFVRSPQAASLLLGMEPGQDSRDLEMNNPGLHGATLRELCLPADIIILSIKRKGQMIISHGYTRLRLGDIVTFVGAINRLDEVTRTFDSA